MKNIFKKNKIVNILIAIIIILLILCLVDNYSVYTIRKSDLENYSNKTISKYYNLDDINDLELLINKEDEDIIVSLYYMDEKYIVLGYSKSIFSNRYKLIDSRYNLKENDKLHFIISSPKNTNVYEIELGTGKKQVNLVSNEKNIERYENTLTTLVLIFLILGFKKLFFKKPNEK